jgi:hypothetical protein
MQTNSHLLRQLSSSIADAPDLRDDWAQSPLSALSDAQLASAVARAIAAPKRDADSSFLTHAPLELAARVRLLPVVAMAARDQARRRIAAIAGDYARAGAEVENAPGAFSDPETALAFLKRAIAKGDAAGADAALLFLIPQVSASALGAALAEEILPMLGAAAHAPILLADLPRLDGLLDGAGALLRAPVAMIAKEAEARLCWHDDEAVAAFDGRAESELFDRLRAPPRVASPSVYVAPIMQAVEADGYAARLLGDVTAAISVEAAARAILRIAALSMLQDDPASAPYGWTHALTMPLGVFGCASFLGDKRKLVRVAATYALGFRATLGKAPIEDRTPERPTVLDLFNVEPIAAAGAAYHAEAARLPEIKTALATRAATHADAHLAKYTLACFDAAARDPEAARFYLAAAAYLGAWWDAHPGESFE